MKIAVSDNSVLALEKNKSTLLIKHGRIYVLSDFEIIEEEKTKKSLFGKNRTYTQKYVTSAIILAYHSEGDFIGVLDDNTSERFLIHNNLYELRKNYYEFMKMLKAFGFELVKFLK